MDDIQTFEYLGINQSFAIIIGIGDGGCNVLSHIYKNNKYGNVDFLAIDTDLQVLNSLEIPLSDRLLIGEEINHGMGAGADPDKGKLSAIKSYDFIKCKISKDYEIAFILVGMGGGTGTGAAPIIAEICKELGIFTITICSIPFSFEGALKQKQATIGIEQLKHKVDTIFLFSNDTIINSGSSIQISEAVNVSNDIFLLPVDVILSAILNVDIINLDFEDVRQTLKESRMATAAIGRGYGDKKIKQAFSNLINSPFIVNLDTKKIRSVLLQISIGALESYKMSDLDDLSQVFKNSFSDSVNLRWGMQIDERLPVDEVKLSCLFTGTEADEVIEYIDTSKITSQ